MRAKHLGLGRRQRRGRRLAPLAAEGEHRHGQGGDGTGHGEGDEIQLQRQVDRHQRTTEQWADDGAVAANARGPAEASGADRQAVELRGAGIQQNLRADGGGAGDGRFVLRTGDA